MPRITGFHRDAENHWVAELECGHTQHVRHNPPWQSRPWVVTEQGRAHHLGQSLTCAKCAEPAALSNSGVAVRLPSATPGTDPDKD